MPVLRSKQLKSQKMKIPTHSKEAAATPQNSTAMPQSTRQNTTHIFFWGGPLSNWHSGRIYSGKRTFELLLPKLAELDIGHPPPEAFSSRLLSSVGFGCGEQWMMAMKGWLFERDIELSEKLFPDCGDSEQEFQLLRKEMLAPTRPSLNEREKRAMYDSCLCKCLRSKSPKDQKSYGRRCRNFDVKVWDVASVPVVVACQIARAEVDDQLRRLYLQSGNRVFVEGSPRDTVWGVGIRWDQVSIENPSNWSGENRLGVCHGIACKAVKELWEEKSGAEQVS
jgi:ribA/ribD-fused uncharacterized protein